MAQATPTLPAFTPVAATPVAATTIAAPDEKHAKNGRAGAAVKAAGKHGTPRKGKAKRVAKAAASDAPAKRVRTSRVAPLMMDAHQALNALGGLSKKEVEVLQALIAQLNPLPRPGRSRVLTAVASLIDK